MKWFDLHCDALNKRYLNDLHSFEIAGQFDVDFPKIQKNKVKVQSFAIYVSDYIRKNRRTHLTRQIACFHNIITDLKMGIINSTSDLELAFMNENKYYGLLSLEGCGDIDDSDETVQFLFNRGLRALSLTWNKSNWAADGALDNFHGGMSLRGIRFVEKCERLGIAVDASHLSERSFWDLVRISRKPIYCSHSNSKMVCKHPRNLTDEQIIELIRGEGLIGITFVPSFLNSSNVSTINDVIKNINHICQLGGVHNIAFGSDFDGIDQHVVGLKDSGDLIRLFEQLSKYYSHEEVEGFTWKNARKYFSQTLPKE